MKLGRLPIAVLFGLVGPAIAVLRPSLHLGNEFKYTLDSLVYSVFPISLLGIGLSTVSIFGAIGFVLANVAFFALLYLVLRQTGRSHALRFGGLAIVLLTASLWHSWISGFPEHPRDVVIFVVTIGFYAAFTLIASQRPARRAR